MLITSSVRIFFLLSSLCCAAHLLAQQQTPPPVHNEQVVVTGTYTPIPMEESDRTVDVIHIEQSPTLYRNAMDALQAVPAVDIRQRAPGIQGDLSIRGSSFGQTLVLVNGLRLNDSQTAHNNLDLPFPFESIQRIEVLEGTGSTLYGADALGGAVNFLTNPPAITEVRAAATGGNFGTNGQNGSIAYLWGSFAEQLTFNRELSTGFRPDRDYRNLVFGSQTTYKSRLGMTDILLGLSDRPFGADDFYGNYPSWERTKGWFAGVTQQLGDDTQVAFGYRRHTDQYILFRDQPSIYENNHITESWQAALRRKNKLAANMSLYYGVEGYRDTIASNNLGHHVRDRGSAYASFDVRALKRFSFNAGVREEYFTGGNSVFTPSLSGGYWMSSHLKLHAAVGTAYRLPTFTDLYYSDPGTRGNPNLLPEKAWSYEAGLLIAFGRQSADVVVFRRHDRNNIDYVRANPTDIWQAANIDDLHFTGVQATLHLLAAANQRIDIAYAALHGAQTALRGLQSQYLFQYPVNSGTITWNGNMPGRLNARVRIGVLQRYARDPYPLLEAAIERRFSYVKPFIQLSNITNTGYEEIPGVPMPGRSYLAGLEFLFRKTSK
jgi:iron complex outermembrane recepter protein